MRNFKKIALTILWFLIFALGIYLTLSGAYEECWHHNCDAKIEDLTVGIIILVICLYFSKKIWLKKIFKE